MNAADSILLALILPAYVLGSIPFGLMVARTRGVDPRMSGSGNIGATNVGRLLGGRFFAIVFILDLLKGLVPMLSAAMALSAFRPDARNYGARDYGLWLAVGLAAILGHMFSVFLKFKGGKGVATSTGVILGLYPYFTIAGLMAAALWVIVLKLTRYVSIASIGGSFGFVLAYLGIGWGMGWPVFGRQWPLLAFAIFIAAMITYKHRGNLKRLRAGTENRFGDKAEIPDPVVSHAEQRQ